MDRKATLAHEFAEIFPMPSASHLAELSERIAKLGQREPIVLLDGKILDGRCREAACLQAGVAPKYRQFGSRSEDGSDPLEFVIDTNLHRRHLSEGERMIAAARYATAKAGDNQHKNRSDQNEQTSELKSTTNEQAAEKFGVPLQKVRRAKKVLAHGTQELQDALAKGEVKVADAAKVSTEPPEVQKKAVEDVRDGNTRTAKASVDQQKEEADPKRKNKRNQADDGGVGIQIGMLLRSLNAYAKNRKNKQYTDCLAAIEKIKECFDRYKLSI